MLLDIHSTSGSILQDKTIVFTNTDILKTTELISYLNKLLSENHDSKIGAYKLKHIIVEGLEFNQNIERIKQQYKKDNVATILVSFPSKSMWNQLESLRE